MRPGASGTTFTPTAASTGSSGTTATRGALFGGSLCGGGALTGFSGSLNQNGELAASLSTLTGLLDTASALQRAEPEEPGFRGSTNRNTNRRDNDRKGWGGTNSGGASYAPRRYDVARAGGYLSRTRDAGLQSTKGSPAQFGSETIASAALTPDETTAATLVASSVPASPTTAPAAPQADMEVSVKLPGAAEAAPWRPKRVLSPTSAMRREVQGLLNKLTIENFPSVGERLAVRIESSSTPQEVCIAVDTVLEKAVCEPDFSQLYGDLCLLLSWRAPQCVMTCPEAGASNKTPSGGFNAVLLTKWRAAFEQLPRDWAFPPSTSEEDKATTISKGKRRVKGMCTLLGELVVRQVIPLRAFNIVASELLSQQPPDHLVEGLCQMLQTAGASLDEHPNGKIVINNCFGRLKELIAGNNVSKRVACLVQDLEDARRVGWHKKIHKDTAKALSSIKEEAAKAELLGGSVVAAQFGTVVQLGERSNLQEGAYAAYLRDQEAQFRQRSKDALVFS